jgi:hypothetical protein
MRLSDALSLEVHPHDFTKTQKKLCTPPSRIVLTSQPRALR